MEFREADTKRRIALQFQYDGTNFNGSQSQASGRTVQDEMEKAIKTITRETGRVTFAGRTDAGVHAKYQILHFDTNTDLDLRQISLGLNGVLAKDVGVQNVFEVPKSFHSRFDAVAREYEYLIYNADQRSPFYYNKANWIFKPIDESLLYNSLQPLVGVHDFASYCKTISADKGTVREIYSIDVQKNENLLLVRIRGNAFLHNMIRIIIGTALHLQFEKLGVNYMKEVLEKESRLYAGPTASPCGLYLSKIAYEPELSSYKSAF